MTDLSLAEKVEGLTKAQRETLAEMADYRGAYTFRQATNRTLAALGLTVAVYPELKRSQYRLTVDGWSAAAFLRAKGEQNGAA